MKKALSKITIATTVAAILFAAFTIPACSNSSGGVPYVPTYAGTGAGTGTAQGGSNGGNTGGGQQNGGQTISLEANYSSSTAVGQKVYLQEITGQSLLMLKTYEIVSGDDLVDICYRGWRSDDTGKDFVIALKAGTAVVKFTLAKETEWSKKYETTITFNITDGSGGGGSQGGSQDTSTSDGLKNYLVGTWTCSGTSFGRNYYGTLELNSNMKGHIKVTLGSDTIHDKDFTWTAYTSQYTDPSLGWTTAKTLDISGTNEGALDGGHSVKTAANSFTMSGNFAFGMPSQTTWTRQ